MGLLIPILRLSPAQVVRMFHLQSAEAGAAGILLILMSTLLWLASSETATATTLVVTAASSIVALRFVAAGRCLPSDSELLDVSGRVVVVSGGNSGIGLETSRELYRRGAYVVMACRSEAKARAAMVDIERTTRSFGGQLVFVPLDFTDAASIIAFAGRVAAVAPDGRVDIVVLNAGCVVPRYRLAPSLGVEWHTAVHVIGPLMVVEALKPLLAKSVLARLVYVSCSAHAILSRKEVSKSSSRGGGQGRLELRTPLALLQALHGPRAAAAFASLGHMGVYGLSKLAGMYVVNCLGDLNRTFNVTSVHPGVSLTGLLNDVAPRWFAIVARFPSLLLMKTAAEAARPALFACLTKDFVRGGYVMDCRDYGPTSGICQLSHWATDRAHGVEVFAWAAALARASISKKAA